MPKSSDAPIAFQKNAADVLALLELVREHVEAETAAVADRRDRIGRDADWGDVGSMAHVREELQQLVIGLRAGPNDSEEDVKADVELDVADARKAAS